MDLHPSIDMDIDQIQAYIDEAKILVDKAAYNEGETILHRVITVTNHQGQFELETDALSMLGRSFWLRGEYDSALNIFTKASELAKKIGYQKGEGFVSVFIASIYKHRGEYNKAISMLRHACSQSQGIDLITQGIACKDIGWTLWELEELKDATQAFRESLPIWENIWNSPDYNRKTLGFGFLDNIVGLAGVLADQNKFDESYIYLEKAKQILKEQDTVFGTLVYNYFAGYAHKKKKELEEAEKFFLNCLEMAIETKRHEYVVRSLLNLSEIALITYQESFDQILLSQIRGYLDELEDLAKEQELNPILVKIMNLRTLLFSKGIPTTCLDDKTIKDFNSYLKEATKLARKIKT